MTMRAKHPIPYCQYNSEVFVVVVFGNGVMNLVLGSVKFYRKAYPPLHPILEQSVIVKSREKEITEILDELETQNPKFSKVRLLWNPAALEWTRYRKIRLK